MAPRKDIETVDLPFNDGTFVREATVSWRILRAIQNENPPDEVWPVLDWFISESQRKLNRGDYGVIPVRGGLAHRCGITGENANERAAAAARWLGRGLNTGDGGFVSAVLWCQWTYRGTRYYTVPCLWTSLCPLLSKHARVTEPGGVL